MRFTADLGHQILAGAKTTHRLPATVADVGLCPHQPGDLLTLQFPEAATDSYGQTILNSDGQPRRGYAHQARLRVQTVTVEQLQDIDHPAARAEGFPEGFGAFLDYWQDTHCGPAGLTDHQMTRPVWIIGFRVEYADTSRYLQRVHGYTGNLARAVNDFDAQLGYLPVVDDRDMQISAELADRKRRRQHAENVEAREQLSLEQRLVTARRTAATKGLVLRDERRVLEAMLKRGDRDGATRAVRTIERAVWPEAA